MDAAELAQVRAEANLKQAKTRLADKQGELGRARAKQTQAATAEAAALAELSKFDTALDAARTMSGDRFGDAAFYERPPEDLQRDTAWLDPETQRLRRLLFADDAADDPAFEETEREAVGPDLRQASQHRLARWREAPPRRRSKLAALVIATVFVVLVGLGFGLLSGAQEVERCLNCATDAARSLVGWNGDVQAQWGHGPPRWDGATRASRQ